MRERIRGLFAVIVGQLVFIPLMIISQWVASEWFLRHVHNFEIDVTHLGTDYKGWGCPVSIYFFTREQWGYERELYGSKESESH